MSSVELAHQLRAIQPPFVHFAEVQVVLLVARRNHLIVQNEMLSLAAQSSLENASSHLTSSHLPMVAWSWPKQVVEVRSCDRLILIVTVVVLVDPVQVCLELLVDW